jgi:hypothetical protein
VVQTRYDVVVAGGGPAGVAAAVAAGRAGAETLLVEKTAIPGGITTGGLMTTVWDFENKPGVIREILDRLDAAGALHAGRFWNPDAMVMVLDGLLAEAGVDVRYHTIVQGAERNGRRITAITTASKSGLETWPADVFIDATGDGDLAAFAGCAFEKGRPGDGAMQPASTFAIVAGLAEPLPRPEETQAVLDKAGFHMTYRSGAFREIPGCPGVAKLVAVHVCGVDPTDAGSLSAAEIDGRRQIHEHVRALRESGDPRFGDLCIVWTGTLAVREGRRIHGLYTLTADDCRAGRTFDDAVCTATFPLDVHHPTQEEGQTWLPGLEVPPYQIPYRCLVARDADNVLLAGRCISGDFYAHGSYRVVGDVVPLGETAGKAAAIASKEDVPLPDISAERVACLSQFVTARPCPHF